MTENYIRELARDVRELLLLMREFMRYTKDAEREIPESIRRFVMYSHDIHDLRNLYHETGIEPPECVLREIERCSDRFRHLVEDLHTDSGAFEQIRREMVKRAGNRYDYAHQLIKPTTGGEIETGNGEQDKPPA